MSIGGVSRNNRVATARPASTRPPGRRLAQGTARSADSVALSRARDDQAARLAAVDTALGILKQSGVDLLVLQSTLRTMSQPADLEKARDHVRAGTQAGREVLAGLREQYVAKNGSPDAIAVLDALSERAPADEPGAEVTIPPGLPAKEAAALTALAGELDAIRKRRQEVLQVAERELEWRTQEAALGHDPFIAAAATPGDAVSGALLRDERLSSEELKALRQRVVAGKLGQADVAAMLRTHGMADATSQQVAGWVTAADESSFRRTFALAGQCPVSIELDPGEDGLQLRPKVLSDVSMKHHSVETHGDLTGLRGTVTISLPVEKPHAFRGGTELPGLHYQVHVQGKTVEVILPSEPRTEHGHMPKLDQVAESLALLPPAVLETVRQVIVTPYRSPQDEEWAVKFNRPGFRAAATGGLHTIHIYPISFEPSQQTIDGILVHEVGHTFSFLKEQYANGAEWKEAMRLDGQSASEYADSSADEDFAEATALYLLRGRDDVALRARFGHRFEKLDKLFDCAR